MTKALKVIPAVIVGLVAVVGASPAFAKSCKGVTLKIKNNSPYAVSLRNAKIFDVYDGRTRTENISNKELLPGQTRREKANLAKIGGKQFQWSVRYKSLVPTKRGDAKWSKRKTSSKTPVRYCSKGGVYTIVITR